MEAKYENNAPGFDFSIVLPLLFEFLIEVLSTCLDEVSPATAESHIKSGSIYTRIAARKAVNAVGADHKLKGSQKRELRVNTLQCCKEADDKEVAELIGEVNGTPLDYGLI